MQRSTKRYFEEEICKSVGRKILESEINSRKCKYVSTYFLRGGGWNRMGFSQASRSEIFPLVPPSSSNKNILETSFFSSFTFHPFSFFSFSFFPLPLLFSVPCSFSFQDAQKSSFSEKSLSRVSLLSTGIIFPRNDKSIVERSFGLEIDLDSVLDFFSTINQCLESKNVLDYLNILYLRCFRIVKLLLNEHNDKWKSKG